MDELVIFKDIYKKELLTLNDFGVVPIGQSKTVECYLANLSDRFKIIEISNQNPDRDLTFSSIPKELSPNQVVAIKLTFKPHIGRREAFNCQVVFSGTLVIG